MLNRDRASRDEEQKRREQERKARVEQYYERRAAESNMLKRALASAQAKRDAEKAIVEEAKALESRTEEATKNLLDAVGEYKKKIEELQKGKRELQHALRAEEAKVRQLRSEKTTSDSTIGFLNMEVGLCKRKAIEDLTKKYEECKKKCERITIEMEKKREKLVAAAKGVVGSDLKGFGAKIGELEGALNEL